MPNYSGNNHVSSPLEDRLDRLIENGTNQELMAFQTHLYDLRSRVANAIPLFHLPSGTLEDDIQPDSNPTKEVIDTLLDRLGRRLNPIPLFDLLGGTLENEVRADLNPNYFSTFSQVTSRSTIYCMLCPREPTDDPQTIQLLHYTDNSGQEAVPGIHHWGVHKVLQALRECTVDTGLDRTVIEQEVSRILEDRVDRFTWSMRNFGSYALEYFSTPQKCDAEKTRLASLPQARTFRTIDFNADLEAREASRFQNM